MSDDKPGKEPLQQENKKSNRRNKQRVLNIFSRVKCNNNESKRVARSKVKFDTTQIFSGSSPVILIG